MTVAFREAEILASGDGTIIPLPGATIVVKARSGLGVSAFLVAKFTPEPGTRDSCLSGPGRADARHAPPGVGTPPSPLRVKAPVPARGGRRHRY